jgi:hypothetical protein
MNALEFIHLMPVGTDSCSYERSTFADELKKAWQCPECGTCKPSAHSVDVQIQESYPGAPINFIYGCQITLVRRDFLEALGTERVNTCLTTGSVYGPSGQLMHDWVTVRGRYRLTVRGSTYAGCRTCKVCERQFYFAMGKRYLYPAPPLDIPLFESDLCGLIVSPEVLDGVSLSRWPKLEMEKLRVLSLPKDSLGSL